MNRYKERGEYLEYFSNFIWEKGNEECSSVSLVLQHVQVRKRSVLLACVCESGNRGENGAVESGYFTEGLVEWFHRSFLRLCEKMLSDAEVEKLLYQEVSRLQEEAGRFVKQKGTYERLHYWGILLWENRFWIFSKGACEGYLVNRRFQKQQLRRLGTCEQLSGRLQYNLGILLCTSGFMSNMKKEEVTEVLALEGHVTDARLENRLQEIWQENVRRGEVRSVGAIYIRM